MLFDLDSYQVDDDRHEWLRTQLGYENCLVFIFSPSRKVPARSFNEFNEVRKRGTVPFKRHTRQVPRVASILSSVSREKRARFVECNWKFRADSRGILENEVRTRPFSEICAEVRKKRVRTIG